MLSYGLSLYINYEQSLFRYKLTNVNSKCYLLFALHTVQ